MHVGQGQAVIQGAFHIPLVLDEGLVDLDGGDGVVHSQERALSVLEIVGQLPELLEDVFQGDVVEVVLEEGGIGFQGGVGFPCPEEGLCLEIEEFRLPGFVLLELGGLSVEFGGLFELLSVQALLRLAHPGPGLREILEVLQGIGGGGFGISGDQEGDAQGQQEERPQEAQGKGVSHLRFREDKGERGGGGATGNGQERP